MFAPDPLPARGWYVLSGYAAQRTNDVLGGLGPDQSSPQSRNLDVAALYFQSPVADGGYGGYLPSDATPNDLADRHRGEDAGGLSGGRLAVWVHQHRAGRDVSRPGRNRIL